MDERLLSKSTNWSLQEDEEVRKSLEECRNNISLTGSKLTLNISGIKQKILNTDCDIQQLNTQLALLKNIKYVEAGVEDEDSRPKPPPPVILPTKEELIKITIDAVKESLQNIPNQLQFERHPLSIERIPLFNDPAFAYFSARSVPRSEENVQKTSEILYHTDENVANTNNNVLIPSKSEPPLLRSNIPSAIVQNKIPTQFVDEESSESEDESEIIGTSHPQIEQSAAPASALPTMNNGHLPSLPLSNKQKSLFSSDEDESENEESAAPIETPVVPIIPTTKPRNDLMEQLAAKLKNKDEKITTEKKDEAIPDKAEKLPQNQTTPIQVNTQEKEISSKVEVKREALPKKEVKTPAPEPQSRKPTQSQNVEKKAIPTNKQQAPANISKTVPQREPLKKKGLFSDSDSDDDFIVNKPSLAAPKLPVVQQKKPEPKVIPKKSAPVKKSIFDSDSDDDNFSGYLKKSSTPDKKGEAPVTQKSVPAPSQGKAVKPEEPKQKTPLPVNQTSLPTSSGANQQSALIEKPLNAPDTVGVGSSLIDPLSAAGLDEVAKPKSIPKTQPVLEKVQVSSDPLALFSEGTSTDLKKDEKGTSGVSVVSAEKKVEVVKSLESTSIISEENQRSVSQKSLDQAILQSKSHAVELFAPPSDEVPPVLEISNRSDSPPEERESSEPLQSENLPSLPSQDSFDEEIMPVGKTPGKLNNANFAAMLGSKLSAGPPGLRPKPPLVASTETENATLKSESNPEAESTTPKADSSSASLSHLTKDRPKRAGVKRPTLHKPVVEEKQTPSVKKEEKKEIVSVQDLTNGLSALKVTSIVAKETLAVKKEETTDSSKSSETEKEAGASKTVASETKPESNKTASVAKTEAKLTATVSTTPAETKPPAKKGLFDFSSSDEEPAPPTKITKAATTLKVSVTTTTTTKEAQTKATQVATKTEATSSSTTTANKDNKTNARLNKYKSMFDQEDDFDVSLFKKST